MATSNEPKGCCREIFPVPFVEKWVGIVFGIVNCFLPGLGLAIAAFLQPGPLDCYYLSIALCQFLFTFLFFGWIWAFINGVLMAVDVTRPSYQERRREYLEKLAPNEPNAANDEAEEAA